MLDRLWQDAFQAFVADFTCLVTQLVTSNARAINPIRTRESSLTV
jgi:hypothetical protein